MTTEYKVGDRVLIEATITGIYASGRWDLKSGNGVSIPMSSEQIYSHVPEIKPGTRVDVKWHNKVNHTWSQEWRVRPLYYVGNTLDDEPIVITKTNDFLQIVKDIRPHLEEETKPTKTVSVEVPDGYKVQVVREEV